MTISAELREISLQSIDSSEQIVNFSVFRTKSGILGSYPILNENLSELPHAIHRRHAAVLFTGWVPADRCLCDSAVDGFACRAGGGNCCPRTRWFGYHAVETGQPGNACYRTQDKKSAERGVMDRGSRVFVHVFGRNRCSGLLVIFQGQAAGRGKPCEPQW